MKRAAALLRRHGDAHAITDLDLADLSVGKEAIILVGVGEKRG